MGVLSGYIHEDNTGVIQAWVEYNDNNLRITDAFWTNSTGRSVQLRIWDETGTLVYNSVSSFTGGSQNVPGNIRVREVLDDGAPYYDFPEGWTWRFEVLD